MSIPVKSAGTGNIYLGDKVVAESGCCRQPGQNTIAYYPLNSNTTINDESGNLKNLTANGTIQYTSTYAHFSNNDDGQSYFYRSDIGFSSGQQFFYGIRFYKDIQETESARIIAPPNRGVVISTNHNNNGMYYGAENLGSASISLENLPSYFNKRVYVFYTGTVGGSVKGGIFYPSGEKYSGTGTGNSLSTGIYIGTNGNSSWRRGDALRGYISDLIIESKEWGDKKIENYINCVKNNYWN